MPGRAGCGESVLEATITLAPSFAALRKLLDIFEISLSLCERLHSHVELPQGNGETDASAGASDEDGLALEPQVDLVAVHDVACRLIFDKVEK